MSLTKGYNFEQINWDEDLWLEVNSIGINQLNIEGAV